MSRPNVLLVLVDCLRADAVRGEGRRLKTPCIDRLVRSGVVFTQAIASSSSTTPCVASLLTGNYSFAHGIQAIGGHKLNRAVPSLVETLAADGYETHAEVTGPLLAETGLGRGFSSYRVREPRAYLSTSWGEELRRRIGGFRAPWFLFVHLWELHQPRQVLPQFRSRAYGRNRYERAVSSLDRGLHGLLEAVPADTLLVLHGDHGERVLKSDLRYRLYRIARDFLGARTRKREGHEMDVYEDVIRVPLVFRWPSVLPAGKAVGRLVRQVDVMPTVLDLVRAPAPAGVHGVSLGTAIADAACPELDAYLEAFLRVRSDPGDRRVGLRTAQWKYVHAPRNPSLPEELYDLGADAGERRNVAAQRPDVVRTLRRRIGEIEAGWALAPPTEEPMTEEERALVEKRLEDLGYL